MKSSSHTIRLSLALLGSLAMSFAVEAITFTNNTLISFDNTNYDGQEVIVSNCVLMVDGSHSFDNLRLLASSTLTHSFSTNGLLGTRISVQRELHSLSDTNSPALNQTNVNLSSIVVQDSSTSTTYSLVLDYTLATQDGVTSIRRAIGSRIPEGGTIAVSYDYMGQPIATGLSLTVLHNVEIESGSAINADGCGYGGGFGPGAGGIRATNSPVSYIAGAGGGHGGDGGASSSLATGGTSYDSITSPASNGSGGGAGSGPGGAGGGTVKLIIGDLLRVDGAITANGANGLKPRSGGGAGGSIWLSASNLSGSGSISANGGAGEPFDGGGAGGGRIAIACATNQFTGTFSAHGGLGAGSGGAGTIYTTVTGMVLTNLLVDNGGLRGARTLLSAVPIVDLTIAGGALVQPPEPNTITVHNLLVRSNSWFSGVAGRRLLLTLTGNGRLETGGGIICDGLGNPAGQGTGHGGVGFPSALFGPLGGGGGYGGFGGAGLTNVPGGNAYGSLQEPVDLGSGGGFSSGVQPAGAGAGGGALQLNVRGNLAVDGTISANGTAGVLAGSGGGSGGSLRITAGKLSGSGLISADGGAGQSSFGGGGGGGRISISGDTNQFTGTLSARGATGANSGGAGTIYTKFGPQAVQLVVDNGGQIGTNTPLTLVPANCDLSILGGAVVQAGNIPYVRNLIIGTSSWLIPSPQDSINYSINVISNATIRSGGGIQFSGRGYATGTGPGAGSTGSTSLPGSGGGGYGGFGGAGFFGSSGGASYGSTTSPSSVGSGGGRVSGNPQDPATGSGGGALKLIVGGALWLDGTIAADGLRGSSQGGGGGAGGSIWLQLGALAGSGLISANGGAGDLPYGGGGGGGRIAIITQADRLVNPLNEPGSNSGAVPALTTNSFTGTVLARGGLGAVVGGAGTIYWQAGPRASLLIADNGGWHGAGTAFSSSGPLNNLILSGGTVAVLTPTAGSLNQTFGNVLIRSNSMLLLTNYDYHFQMTVLTNLMVEPGAIISADGAGYRGGQGPGAGRSSYNHGGGGGGFGGYGGPSAFADAGGNAYGSVSVPGDPGSGGGGSGTPAGAGGGALQLTVNGSALLDGRISTDGSNALGQGGGGGAGGSLRLTVGTLAGSGSISANGGAGDLPYGGGGGGGRIAVSYQTNSFKGIIMARGGAGAAYGGAGTIYVSSSKPSAPTSRILVDNGGAAGADTLLASTTIPISDLFISGGASVEPPTIGTSLTLNRLSIASNSWLTSGPLARQPSALVLSLQGEATIEKGGGIQLDGKGNLTGPGAGGLSQTPAASLVGGGGGYGGYGGTGAGNALGGRPYGSIKQPVELGSGGGTRSLEPTKILGSAGGGALHLTSTGKVVLNGFISANGANAAAAGAGGGSGGSIWLTVGSLSGTGLISANGGAGDAPQGGGGGGGRIAVDFVSNKTNAPGHFEGSFSAHGGSGAMNGGAGTIFLAGTSDRPDRLIVDNGGSPGANTPLTDVTQVSLTISGGAMTYPTASPLELKGLVLSSGANMTSSSSLTNLEVMVFGDATIATNTSISVDAKGYSGLNAGPGTGLWTANSDGSGGGYGGAGGASLSGAPGGQSYGSAAAPVDRGSRGGLGSFAVYTNACQGGGAIRLKVTGLLTVDGSLTANGNSALPEGAGGGAGGSIWVTTRRLTGAGIISANGGDGNPSEGGGGGGGRIALYCGSNSFSGPVQALGGEGANPGGDGTIVLTNLPALQVIAQQPEDIVSYAVNAINLIFNSPLNPATARQSRVLIETPSGRLPQDSTTLSVPGAANLRIGLPSQTTVGYYEFLLGQQIEDIYGAKMEAPYYGSFVILAPTISGRVTDTNGLPAAFVTIQAGQGLTPVLTDTNGLYSLTVLPSWTGTLTPSHGTWSFLPPSRSYQGLTASLTNQNFIMASPGVFALGQQREGDHLRLRWYGASGVSYQALVSTNLVDWAPCALPSLGTNGAMSLSVPVGAEPVKFYRLQTSY